MHASTFPLSRSALLLLLASLLALVAPVAIAADKKDGEDEKKGPPKYSDVITDKAVSDEGLFLVHRIEDDLFFEIPTSLLGRDMLMVSRIARVPADMANGFMAAGHKAGEQVVRWERHGKRILLRRVSYRNVADPEEPIYRSVENNNFFPILASFDVEIEGPPVAEGDTTTVDPAAATVVIKVNDLYLDDVPALSGLPKSIRDDYKIKKLDGDRSFLNYARSYPENVEVRTTLTFTATEPPVDADTETLSLEMHQSMVLLPEQPMRARFADPRVGWFTVERINYGLDAQKAAEEVFIRRWRLEPSDPAAYARGELTDPVKPIVYYLDPATPEKWRPYVRQGVEDWQKVFESAGFSNAIVALDAPTPEEDPEWSGEDVRHSMVRWAANRMRNAMGPSVSDPRSGEIIESDIVWYHNHMRSYRNRLMLETGAANPLARSLPIDDALMGEAMRQVIAHEIGHALGLPHNMIASAAYPVESLRDPEFVRRMGVSASIMEYARQNYVAQPGDGLEGADFIRQMGPYDHYAINWGYRVLPQAATPADEKPILDGWIREKADDPIYRFGPQRGGLPIDPRIQTEDLGDDPVKASGYAIANLKRVTPELIAWTTKPGEDYTDLRELYGELFWQYTRYCRHVVSVVGGVTQDLKASDQEGPVYVPVPAGKQREAMAFLAENAFRTPEWILDQEILRRIDHAGDLSRVESMQSRILEDLLDPGRMQRLVEAEANGHGDSYGLMEFMDDLTDAVWVRGPAMDPYRRALQRSHLERLEYLMTQDPSGSSSSWAWTTPVDVSTSDIRAAARAQLAQIRRATRAAGRGQGEIDRAHFRDVEARIEEMLNPPGR